MPAPGFILSWIPLAAHIGYVIATSTHLPALIGRTADKSGVGFGLFLFTWFSIIAAANLAFFLLHLRLPELKELMLQVPGRAHWLSTPERKALLIGRLRGIVETALFGLNIFFWAVYQTIYQANAARPLIRLELPVLMVGFMLLPLALVVVQMALAIRRLAIDAREKDDV